MLGQRDNLHRLPLVWTLATVLCLLGCCRREPTGAADIHYNDKAAESAPERAEYANDLDRLDQLTERINRACGSSYVAVLGAGDSSVSGGLVSIDYEVFDRLSDEGAGVLIAEAIVSGSKLPSPTQTQAQADTVRVVLQSDEAVGRYTARAGFSSAGFAEWLNVKKLSAVGLRQGELPGKIRVAAFMRGYISESSGEGR